MVRLDVGVPAPAVTGDVSLLGCVVRPDANGGTDIVVITSEDAVYGVADRHPRVRGTRLDLAGASGAQRVGEAVNNDFEVVADSTADEDTALRIAVGRHHDFVAAPAFMALTPVHERQLVLAAAAGEQSATEELIDTYMPAIAGIARMYRSAPSVDRTELLQEGVVGLLRAARRFDPSLSVHFWAYAAWWVRQAMQQLVSELTRPTVLSDRAQRGLAHIREARRGYFQAHGREPTPSELSTLVNLSRERVESLLAVERAPQPLEKLVTNGNGQSRDGDVLVDPVAEEEYEQIIARLEIEQLRDLTTALTPRERKILSQHHGLDGPAKSLRAIGKELGISAERVRQIEARSLEKLRTAMLDPPG